MGKIKHVMVITETVRLCTYTCCTNVFVQYKHHLKIFHRIFEAINFNLSVSSISSLNVKTSEKNTLDKAKTLLTLTIT